MAAVLRQQQEDIETSTDLIARYQRVIALRPGLEAQLSEAQTRGGSLAGLWTGDNAALTAAQLQNAVKIIVEGAGGSIRSAQALPSAVVDGFEKVEVRYDLSAPRGALTNIIYVIESYAPFLFIQSLTVHAPEMQLSDGSQAVEQMLAASFTIRGYRWVGTP